MDIKLVPIQQNDLEIIRNWRNSAEISQYMYTNDQISQQQQENWFKNIQTDVTQKLWMIEYDDQKIGVANLYNIKQNFKTCYWGFYLGNSSIRGAGIGSKVEYNVLKYVLEEMNFNKLLCEVFISNESVIKMHEKFGFRREGYFREQILKNNKFIDIVSLAMLQSEWKSVKEYHYNRIYTNEA